MSAPLKFPDASKREVLVQSRQRFVRIPSGELVVSVAAWLRHQWYRRFDAYMRRIKGLPRLPRPAADSPFAAPAPEPVPPAPQVCWAQCDDPTCPMLAACRAQMNPPPGVQADITLPPGSYCSRGRDCLMGLRRDN